MPTSTLCSTASSPVPIFAKQLARYIAARWTVRTIGHAWCSYPGRQADRRNDVAGLVSAIDAMVGRRLPYRFELSGLTAALGGL